MSASSDSSIQILIFEDNSADAELVREYLELSGLDAELHWVKRLSEGLAYLEGSKADLILLDLSLPDSQGLETLRAVLKLAGEAGIIVLTGADDQNLSLRALKAGAQDYLNKDRLNAEILGRAIRYAIERNSLLRRIESHASDAEGREAFLRRIFDASIDAMLILGAGNEIMFLNRAAAVLLDASPEDLLGQLFPFEVSAAQHTELEIPGSDGSNRFVELNAVDLTWQGADALLVVLRDMTRRLHAEAGMKREKERLAVTLDTITDAVIATDADGKVERVNQEASRLVGMSNAEAVGRPLGKVLRFRHPKTGKAIADPAKILLEDADGKVNADLGVPLIRSDESEVLVSAEMRCILDDDQGNHGCVVVLRDITALKRAEEEMFKTEKLQSISLLAGGIAHDFNNILTAVLGNISVARMGLEEENGHADKLLAAEKAALQAKSLTQQLLTFSKGGTPLLEATTIDRLVEDSAQFILRGSNVRCEISKAKGLWAVDADKGQISQVVNNLTINADQAMPDGGVIHVALTNESLKRGEISGLDKGDYVCIAVRDEGIGISRDNLSRIFDPYFTTKEEGNGLGLASAYSIIKSHRGAMTVDSVLGEGSTFCVYLPRATKAPVEESAPEEEADVGIQTGTGRILVMDDMEAMMLVAGEILKVLGYEVEFSTNGEEAIEAYKAAKENGTPFDAVVFDLTVPGGMGGEEACKILKEYDPELVAVASSGYTTSNVMSDFESAGFSAVVPKPYRIKEMSAALQRILP